MTLLPLSTGTYGDPDDAGGSDSYWCFIRNRHNSPSWSFGTWTIVGFYVWVWIAIIASIIMYIQILYKLHRSEMLNYSIEFNTIISSLILYPLVLILCWSFTSAVDVQASFASDTTYLGDYLISILGTVLPASQGFFNSLIFISQNKSVQNEWKKLLLNSYKNNLNNLNNLIIRNENQNENDINIIQHTENESFGDQCTLKSFETQSDSGRVIRMTDLESSLKSADSYNSSIIYNPQFEF